MKRVSSILFLFLLFMGMTYPVQAVIKDWTVMVFINADNNLDYFGEKDQNEMAEVGSNDWLNIITLLDRQNKPAKMNFVKKGTIETIKDMGEVDMGDYKVLVQFVKDTVAAYPAKKYALIIWNHGSGWKDPSASGEMQSLFRGLSYDDQSGNHMTTAELGKAAKEIKGILGKNLDIWGMDACLMQMVEVAYALKDNCGYVVASEETEPGDGYPYTDILKTREYSPH